jgi:hypothetical protein
VTTLGADQPSVKVGDHRPEEASNPAKTRKVPVEMVQQARSGSVISARKIAIQDH